MNEQVSECSFNVYGERPASRFLTYGTEIQVPGDPDSAEDFLQAHQYLEAITAHFLEFGPLEEKTPQDVVDELSYHNRWYQYEVEQAQKVGKTQVEYREITLTHLRALSKRRLLAMTQRETQAGEALPIAQYVDQLIEQAVADEEALDSLTRSSAG